MSLGQRLMRWEGMVFGFILGVVVTIAGNLAYHEITCQLRLSAWQRAIENHHVGRVADLMEATLATARTALEEGGPLAFSEYLSAVFMGHLYEHQMAFMKHLLEHRQIDRFNQLRSDTRYLTLALNGADLSGLDLTGADFAGAELARVDLSGSILTRVDMYRARLTGANLSGADLSRAHFGEADLTDALLAEVHGRHPDFRFASLVGASLTRIVDLTEARFDDAILSDASLWRSSFPGAVFSRADMTIASAVEADFSAVAAMDDVTLTGANLGSSKLEPASMPRAWLVNTDGISRPLGQSLRRHGAVLKSDDVLRLVDHRIVAGFRAQIESNAEITADRRHAVLIDMLHSYYQG